MTAVAVLGLGAMGSRLAVNYAAVGHDVTVWNRTAAVATDLAADHEMTAADSIADALRHAEVVVAMVSDDAAAEAVWLGDDGAFASMGPGTVAIESSTLTPSTVGRLADAAAAAGVGFVEAPVVGSRPQADAGALFYLLGGDSETIDAAMPIIDVNAGNVTRVGEAGNAAVLKLAINGLFAAQVAAYAEVVGLVERSDLDDDVALTTLKALPITSPGLQRILGLIEDRDFEPNFPISLVAKDLDYLAAASAHLGTELPIMTAARAVFQTGRDDGFAALDIAGIARRYTHVATTDANRGEAAVP